LAEKHPDRFASWLLGREVTGTKVFKTELSLEPVRADSVTFLKLSDRIGRSRNPVFSKNRVSEIPRAPEQTDAIEDGQLLGATLLATQSADSPGVDLVEGNQQPGCIGNRVSIGINPA
jgi:hypothetical protein